MFLRWGKFRGRVKGFKHWIQQWHQTFLLLLGGSSSRCSRCAFLRRNFTWCKVVFLVDPGHWIQVPNESHMDIALTWVDVSCSPCFARSSGVDIFDFRNKFGLPALCCPELPGAEAEPQVPNPLAMLPPLAWSVKPLIFSWNSRTLWDDFLWSWELLRLLKLLSLSFMMCHLHGHGIPRAGDDVLAPWFYCHFQLGRMTAEWPRGKVQKLSVSYQIMGFPLVIKQSR